MGRPVYLLPDQLELCSRMYTYNMNSSIPMEITEEKQTYIAGFTFLLGLQAILLNLYVLNYYQDKREAVSPLYYFIMTLCNAILGLDAVLHTLLLVLYVLLDHSPHHTGSDQRLFNYIIFVIYTLTSTARNSKIVYNTIIISMRAVKYCSPHHVFSRKTSAAAILLFPILWMLFLAGALNFQFALPAEVNMQQYIYFPEPNSSYDMKVVSLVLLYILPLSIILTSLGVCLYKQRQKHSPANVHKHKTDKSRSGVQEPTYGQHKGTDIALTALLLACYLPYVVLMLMDIAVPNRNNRQRLDCSLLFMTGVVLPFMNSAFDPIIFIVYNTEMSGHLTLQFHAACDTCFSPKRGVRFDVDAGVRRAMSERRQGSMCIMKSRMQQDVIEYKDSDVESDSSLESFEYTAKKHKSRRYR